MVLNNIEICQSEHRNAYNFIVIYYNNAYKTIEY